MRASWKVLVPLACLAGMLLNATGAEPIELRKDDVVAFVGGTDMVRIQRDGRLEAALTARFKEAKVKFRDLAWDGDTVYFQSTVRERWRRDAFGKWRDQLKRVGATVVVAQFGKIESLDGTERLGDFEKAYGELLEELSADGMRLFLLEPASFEWERADASALPKYSQSAAQLARKRNIPFVSRKIWTGLQAEPAADLVASVREKHRLWYEYWRPANWKCLFGDDSKRIFSNAAEGLPSFKEEWSTYPKLIEAAEAAIRKGEAWKAPAAPKRTGSPEAGVEKELASFDVLDGFEVNLFADESQGISNPLSVRWDAGGRMYVACSDVYPQIEPGVHANDKIIALHDTNNDGRADQSLVFAHGLQIPTGMEVGPDRVYVGQGTDLLTLRDTDGNGVADERKLLLSGFGNGDSHQTINSFVWSPGGELWFCQGDGIESRVETPHGVSSLFQAGVFRLRLGELQLDGLLDDFMGPGNPWGVAFDDFGQSFVVDGAGGISYLTPASIPAKRRLRLPRIGKPGGYCGVECLGASTLPEAMQGEFLIGDYKKNQVSRFAVVEDGAGFKVEFKDPILRSKHRNFRPIDVKMGPDGAIYVVDWYNPITCHQDDFYRHPGRDKTHGRIWRIARKGSTLKKPNLLEASVRELLNALQSPERWTRLKAKQVLATRDKADVLPVLHQWLKAEGDVRSPRRLLEAVALLEWMDVPNDGILSRLLKSSDHRARAYAARIAGRWGKRLAKGRAHELLVTAAGDSHPRVRMEAALACAAIPEARSVLIAATVAEMPRDRWINYAFSQAVHHLKGHWIPAFRRGELDFGNARGGMAAVLGQADSKSLIDDVRKMIRSGEVKDEARRALGRVLVALGEEADVKLILDLKPPNPELLRALKQRKKPEFDVADRLSQTLESDNLDARVAVMELAGHWREANLRRQAASIAVNRDSDPKLRSAALRALGSFGGDEARKLLKKISGRGGDPLKASAVGALLDIDSKEAAAAGAKLLGRSQHLGTIKDTFAFFAARQGATRLLSDELGKLKESMGKPQASRLRMAWLETGLVDAELSARLDGLAQIKAAGFVFSDALVKELAAAGLKGDAKRGEALFHSARAGCAACHKVGDRGGAIGPDLSAVGSGILPGRIVTEVLWPAQQVKEGYSLTRVTMKSGQVIQGYLQASRKESTVLLRDFATNKMHEISSGELAKRESIGSLMPATVQTLSREQITDLLRYLFSLRGQ